MIPHAPGLHVDCPHCHKAHHRCIGHYDRAAGPEPCGRAVSDDGSQCSRHGGPQTSQARQRARRTAIKPRVKAMNEAIATLNALGVQIETDPLDALIGQLAESAGVVAIFRERLQQLRIPDLRGKKAKDGSITYDVGGPDALWGPDHTGDQAQHILLGFYNEERERFAKLADLALRAGVAERQVRIMEQQATLFAELLRKVLDDPELGLSPQQRQTGRRVAAAHLRLVGSS